MIKLPKWIFILSLFTGCFKVGPNFCPPEAPLMEEWIESGSPEVKTQETLIRNWWRVFNDSTLEKLVHTAYKQNLTLEAACYRILEARAAYGIAVGEFFPQVQEAVGSAQRLQETNPGPLRRYDDFQLGLEASWELDFWGKYRRAIEAQGAEVIASLADYNDILVILLSNVATFYVEMRTFEEQLEIVKNNVKLQARSVEISTAQFKGGFVSELDVQQATTLLKDTEARIPNLERQYAQARNALCTLLGIVPQELDIPKGTIPTGGKDIVVNMPESLLYRRPDIRRSLYQAAAQSARIGVAYADFFPQISLTGTVGFESGGKLFSSDTFVYTYGGNFAWPLLNYGRISSRVALERARFCEFVTNFQNTVLVAYQEVENGIIGFIKNQKQEESLEESVTAAKRAVELANTQYVEGMVDYTTVLNTLEAQLREEEKETLVRGDIATSMIATYRALGGGWEIQCAQE